MMSTLAVYSLLMIPLAFGFAIGLLYSARYERHLEQEYQALLEQEDEPDPEDERL